MTDKRIVFTTEGSEDEANKIARFLVEQRLAACVNIVPQVLSIYRWQGKVEESREWLLMIKTTAAAFEKLSRALAELHSYEIPECVCLPIEEGSPVTCNGSPIRWMRKPAGDSRRRRNRRSYKRRSYKTPEFTLRTVTLGCPGLTKTVPSADC